MKKVIVLLLFTLLSALPVYAAPVAFTISNWQPAEFGSQPLNTWWDMSGEFWTSTCSVVAGAGFDPTTQNITSMVVIFEAAAKGGGPGVLRTFTDYNNPYETETTVDVPADQTFREYTALINLGNPDLQDGSGELRVKFEFEGGSDLMAIRNPVLQGEFDEEGEIPEPATLAFGITGMGIFGLLKRKKRKGGE